MQYKWLWSYARKVLHLLIIGFTLTLASTGLALVAPYVVGRVVLVVFEQGNHGELRGFIYILVIATLIKSASHYAMRRVFEEASQRVLIALRRDIYDFVQRQTYAFFDANRVGDIMARLTGDMDAIRHFVAFVAWALFENVVVLTAALFLMFTVSWELALLILSLTPVIFVCAYKQSKEIKPAFGRIREQFSALNTVCQENISGNKVVKAFAREEYEIEKFESENREFYDANVDSAKIWMKYVPLLDFCAGLLFFILIVAGGLLVINGRLELWRLVTVNGYLWAVSNPLRMSGWLINDTQRFNASLDKIHAMISEPVTITSPQGGKSPAARGEVEFDRVSFAFDKGKKSKQILSDISFKVKPGQTIGIVGKAGAGKTTLVNLIGRFYDVTAGRVLVDGLDVREYDLKALRKRSAYATQDVFLFSDTIEGNIAYGEPEAPVEDVYAAAKTAAAHEFILETTDGYDTIIGERGVGLSGGQRQRLALARALAVKPCVLILDDTTSAVDMQTEYEIQNALDAGYKTQTRFIIAHRLSSVIRADLIIVLDEGKIIEQGTHKELLAKGGQYADMFEKQYG